MDWLFELLTPLGTTGYYRATTNLQNSQFTTTPAKTFPSAVF
jgi:hypothetical protein